MSTYVDDALDHAGVPHKETGWEPASPPSVPAYAVVSESVKDIGCDEFVMARVRSASVALYDDGTPEGRAFRDSVSEALLQEGVSHEMSATDYIYGTKRFVTFYDCEPSIEKRSIANGKRS